MTRFYPPSLAFAGHPYMPERLGYTRLLGLVKPDAARAIRAAKPYTLMSSRNLTTLYREGLRTIGAGVKGDFVEIGVHRGGSAGVLAELIKGHGERHLHLFDRWGDLPEPTPRDGARYDEYRKDRIVEKLDYLRDHPPLEDTRELIEDVIGFPTDRLHYYPGWYSETLADYRGGPIAFASLDCDYYESMTLALDFLEQHALPTATVVADDYFSWPGAQAAVDEWIAKTPRKVQLLPLRTGPAIIRLHG